MIETTMNYRMSESVADLFAALSEAQKVMTGAVKDAENPHFRSKYADLASVWEACRRPLADNGLAVIQPVSADGAKVTISTILAHKSGQWIASDLTLTSVKGDPQGIGSAITYGRRYGLSAMVGISPEDDDGNSASEGGREEGGRSKPRRAQEQPRPTAVPSQRPVGATTDAIKTLKAEIGDKLFYHVMEQFGVKAPADIKSQEQAMKILNELGRIRATVIAASHGELAKGATQELFEALPEESRGKLLREMKQKIAKACKDVALAEREYESLRGNCDTQWELYQALDRAHEHYATGTPRAS